MSTDGTVRTILGGIVGPIKNAPWSIVPYEIDNKVKSEDKKIADILNDKLNNLARPLSTIMGDILLAYTYGHSICEIIWERVNGFTMLKDLSLRSQQSIKEWLRDSSGNLIGIRQRLLGGGTVDIPWDKKLLIYTIDQVGEDYTGVPPLRHLYRPWWIRDHFFRYLGIIGERAAVPGIHVTVPNSITKGSPEWIEAEKFAKNLRAAEDTYLVTNENYKVDMLNTDSLANMDKINESLDRLEREMLSAAGAIIFSIGTEEKGSYAKAEVFYDMYYKYVEAEANYLADVINRQVIKTWVDINGWLAGKEDIRGNGYPKLIPGIIKPPNVQLLDIMIKNGVIHVDQDVENAIRADVGLAPLKSKPTEEETEESPVTSDMQPEEESNVEMSVNSGNKAVKLQERAPNTLTKEERIPNWNRMETKIDAAVFKLLNSLLKIRDRQASRIINDLASGKAPQRIIVPFKDEMFSSCVDVYTTAFTEGKKELLEELRVQGIKLANPPKKFADYLKWFTDKIAIFIDDAGNKLKSILTKFGFGLRKAGNNEEAIKKIMSAGWKEWVGTATWANLASSPVMTGLNDGRAAEAEVYKDEIEYAYRSAVMDKGTCETCRAKDGIRHEVGDPNYATPDPECEGTEDRCRCITIYVAKGEEAT